MEQQKAKLQKRIQKIQDKKLEKDKAKEEQVSKTEVLALRQRIEE
jgi:hypothetical protein